MSRFRNDSASDGVRLHVTERRRFARWKIIAQNPEDFAGNLVSNYFSKILPITQSVFNVKGYRLNIFWWITFEDSAGVSQHLQYKILPKIQSVINVCRLSENLASSSPPVKSLKKSFKKVGRRLTFRNFVLNSVLNQPSKVLHGEWSVFTLKNYFLKFGRYSTSKDSARNLVNN